MVISLRITPNLAKQLAVIRDVGPDRLVTLLRRIDGESKRPLLRNELRASIAQDLGDEVARPVTDQLVALAIFNRREGMEATRTVQSLTAGLDQTNWTTAERDGWNGIKDILAKLLDTKWLKLVAKAVDLGRDYEKVVESIGIITDIRPVFDEPRERIVGSLVTQTLRVLYFGVDGQHSMSFVLDHRDLADLLEACQAARTKAQRAQQLMEQSGTQTIWLGDDSDGAS